MPSPTTPSTCRSLARLKRRARWFPRLLNEGASHGAERCCWHTSWYDSHCLFRRDNSRAVRGLARPGERQLGDVTVAGIAASDIEGIEQADVRPDAGRIARR